MTDPVVTKLREIRDRERLSTGALARRLDVDQSTLYLVFQGKRGVGRKLLDRAIAAFPELVDSHAQPLTSSHDDMASEPERLAV